MELVLIVAVICLFTWLIIRDMPEQQRLQALVTMVELVKAMAVVLKTVASLPRNLLGRRTQNADKQLGTGDDTEPDDDAGE